jgi:hypothetical protein
MPPRLLLHHAPHIPPRSSKQASKCKKFPSSRRINPSFTHGRHLEFGNRKNIPGEMWRMPSDFVAAVTMSYPAGRARAAGHSNDAAKPWPRLANRKKMLVSGVKNPALLLKCRPSSCFGKGDRRCLTFGPAIFPRSELSINLFARDPRTMPGSDICPLVWDKV